MYAEATVMKNHIVDYDVCHFDKIALKSPVSMTQISPPHF